jgi:hypothetical protein
MISVLKGPSDEDKELRHTSGETPEETIYDTRREEITYDGRRESDATPVHNA